MGETQKQPFQLPFNASLKVDFQGWRVTSDGGLILVRELDERPGFGELIHQHLTDSRRGKDTQFPFTDLLRQSVYSRLARYKDLNDADMKNTTSLSLCETGDTPKEFSAPAASTTVASIRGVSGLCRPGHSFVLIGDRTGPTPRSMSMP